MELFARQGVKINQAQARGPMGLHKRDHIAALIGLPEVATQWEEIHGAPSTDQDVDRMYAEFIPLQAEALSNHGDVIPGVVETVESLRSRGVLVGATTGYNREMLNVVLKCSAKNGFVPDAAVCAEDVAAGRPAPWMLFRAMEELCVFPANAVVAVGDTIPDIAAGLNAGVWTVGVLKTGNMLGLTKEEVDALSEEELDERLKSAREVMAKAGAHGIVDDFTELPSMIADFESHIP